MDHRPQVWYVLNSNDLDNATILIIGGANKIGHSQSTATRRIFADFGPNNDVENTLL